MVCVKSDRLAVRLHIGIFIKNSGAGIVTDGRRAQRLAVSIMPHSVSTHIRSDIGHHFYDWEFLHRKGEGVIERYRSLFPCKSPSQYLNQF